MKRSAISAIVTGLLSLAPAAVALEVGQNAPCVVLDNLQTNGKTKEQCIRDHSKTQTHTLIEFSSIHCSACKRNLPILSTLAAQVTNQATTRVVLIDRNESDARKFVSNNSRYFRNIPVAFDIRRAATRAYDLTSTPTLFVLDGKNKIVYKHTGLLRDRDVAKIKTIVGAKR